MGRVEIFENERATGYNEFVDKWIPNYNYFLDRLPKLFGKTASSNLLVVGCGTGNEIEKFIGPHESWKITGVDPSPEMIEQAKNRFSSHDSITLIEGTLSDLDINTKFSAATLLLVLHFFDDNGDKLNLLKDISDRLVSGASFVMLDITGNKDQIKENLQILKCLLPDELEDEDIEKRLKRIETELCSVSEERLSELCQEAGFESPLRFFQSSIYMGWITKKK